MITLTYQDLLLTMIAITAVAVTAAVIWAAYRTTRVAAAFEGLAPRLEQFSIHANELFDRLTGMTDELDSLVRRARLSSSNGALERAHVDVALALIRQLSALGMGIKSAVDTYQEKRSK